ncbi:hypothetical protein FKW77_008402 [Venturia effusa]|uniref:Uncharacterized protein n=1 Tax=Venturia effusa TaxID=50376 RepID=A0A517L3U8_9PEZI|nr:hypothetical protein FKW77_008402 [Venturia effusa]
MTEYYTVWKLKFSLSFQDPDVPGTRFHTTVFVETDAAKGHGWVHHATGDITSSNGMTYESKFRDRPESSQTFAGKEFLGYVAASTYPESFNTVLLTVPLPPQQKAFNTATMKTEPFKTRNPLTFYNPGEPRRPLIKCTEWTEQRAIPALHAAGLLQQPASQTTTSTSSMQPNINRTQTEANAWEWDDTEKRYRYWDAARMEWIWAGVSK